MIHFAPITSQEIEQVLVFDEFYKVHPSRREEVERAILDESGYIIIVDEITVGYGIFRPYGLIEESFIHLLIINPKYQGKGYAQAFMKYFESLTKSKKIHISMNASNIPMQNLVKKLGYKEGGILKSFDENDPEIFFYKHLE